jgi:hypothetical protein
MTGRVQGTRARATQTGREKWEAANPAPEFKKNRFKKTATNYLLDPADRRIKL